MQNIVTFHINTLHTLHSCQVIFQSKNWGQDSLTQNGILRGAGCQGGREQGPRVGGEEEKVSYGSSPFQCTFQVAPASTNVTIFGRSVNLKRKK